MPIPQHPPPKDNTSAPFTPSHQDQCPTSDEWFEDAILRALDKHILKQHNQTQP